MPESLEQWTRRVAAATPAPAGGSVAAVTAALAAALVTMVGRIAQNRRGGAEDAGLAQLVDQGDQLRARLLDLAEEDARAYAAVMEAKRSGAGEPAEREARLRAAWRHALRVPADVVRLGREVAQLARRVARDGPASTVGDAVMAALLATAAASGSVVNLRLNLQAAGRPEELRIIVDEAEVILREAQRAAAEARLAVEERLKKTG
jgi:formiminotetrahydrofolate cyclodeaminase